MSLASFVEACDRFPDKLAFGVPTIDTVLPHGIPCGLVTEFCGSFGTGKSTLLLHYAAYSLENPRVHVIFVDFKKDCYKARLLPFLRQLPWGCITDYDTEIADRVSFYRFTIIDEFNEFLSTDLNKKVAIVRSKDPNAIILLLIDNIFLPFKWYVEPHKGEMLNCIRNTGMNLRVLTSDLHLYTVVTNSTIVKLDIDKETRRLLKEYSVPCLGKPWLDCLDTRILLESDGKVTTAKCVYCWCQGNDQRHTAQCAFKTGVDCIQTF